MQNPILVLLVVFLRDLLPHFLFLSVSSWISPPSFFPAPSLPIHTFLFLIGLRSPKEIWRWLVYSSANFGTYPILLTHKQMHTQMHFHMNPQFAGPGKNPAAVGRIPIKEVRKLYNCRWECVCVCIQCEREREEGKHEGSMCENWVLLFHGQVFLDTHRASKAPLTLKRPFRKAVLSS